jgi:hypothetical protein
VVRGNDGAGGLSAIKTRELFYCAFGSEQVEFSNCCSVDLVAGIDGTHWEWLIKLATVV